MAGRLKSVQSLAGRKNNGTYVGGEASAKAGVLILKASIERSIVTNWHGMEKIGHQPSTTRSASTPLIPQCF
jgi:actin-related protein